MQQDEETCAYFTASLDLKSADLSVRHPAISILITLAQRATAPVRARAVAILIKEFGPFVVIDGLSGCAAPIVTVHECDTAERDCSGCEWLWRSSKRQVDVISSVPMSLIQRS